MSPVAGFLVCLALAAFIALTLALACGLCAMNDGADQ